MITSIKKWLSTASFIIAAFSIVADIFILEPTGKIDYSVLIVCGQFLIYSAILLGMELHYLGKYGTWKATFKKDEEGE